jgi:hypothetical protein
MSCVETELKFFTLKNKIFGIMESLLYQNLYKTKKLSLLNEFEIHLGFFPEKEWLRIKSMIHSKYFSNNILNEPQ